jgi:hypothetical protein
LSENKPSGNPDLGPESNFFRKKKKRKQRQIDFLPHKSFQVTWFEKTSDGQGDQIGPFFDHCAVVYFGQFFNITKVAQIIYIYALFSGKEMHQF